MAAQRWFLISPIPFKRYHADQTIEIQPAALLIGQMRRQAMIEPTGQVKLFGIRFRPGGAYPFFHFSFNELTDKIINLDEVWPRIANELAEKIHEDYEMSEYFTRQNQMSDFYNTP